MQRTLRLNAIFCISYFPSSSDQQGEIQLDINKRKIRMKKIQICSKYKLKINAIIQWEIIIAIYILLELIHWQIKFFFRRTTWIIFKPHFARYILSSNSSKEMSLIPIVIFVKFRFRMLSTTSFSSSFRRYKVSLLRHKIFIDFFIFCQDFHLYYIIHVTC